MNSSARALGSIMLLISASAAFAAPSAEVRNACKADTHSFCREVKPGEGRVANCLEEHYKELTDECYAALQHRPNQKTGLKSNRGLSEVKDKDSD